MAEAMFHPGLGVRGGAISVQVDDLDLAKVMPEFDEPGDEGMRRGGASVHIQPITRVHDGNGFIEGDHSHRDRMTGQW
jgi:hypothetical protein